MRERKQAFPKRQQMQNVSLLRNVREDFSSPASLWEHRDLRITYTCQICSQMALLFCEKHLCLSELQTSEEKKNTYRKHLRSDTIRITNVFNLHCIKGSYTKQDEEFLRPTEFLYLETCHVPDKYHTPSKQRPLPLAEPRQRVMRRTFLHKECHICELQC